MAEDLNKSEKLKLRDWFAGMALQAMLPKDGVFKKMLPPEHLARLAYNVADVMLEIRDKKEPEDKPQEKKAKEQVDFAEMQRKAKDQEDRRLT